MLLHHQRVNRVQKVHLSSNVANLISYPGDIHNTRMYISLMLMLSNAFSSYQFGLTPLKTEESLMNNEICSKQMYMALGCFSATPSFIYVFIPAII